jgi:hypothetical protein
LLAVAIAAKTSRMTRREAIYGLEETEVTRRRLPSTCTPGVDGPRVHAAGSIHLDLKPANVLMMALSGLPALARRSQGQPHGSSSLISEATLTVASHGHDTKQKRSLVAYRDNPPRLATKDTSASLKAGDRDDEGDNKQTIGDRVVCGD